VEKKKKNRKKKVLVNHIPSIRNMDVNVNGSFLKKEVHVNGPCTVAPMAQACKPAIQSPPPHFFILFFVLIFFSC